MLYKNCIMGTYHNNIRVPDPTTCLVKYTHGITANGKTVHVRKGQRLTIIGICGYGYIVTDNKKQQFEISSDSIKDVK